MDITNPGMSFGVRQFHVSQMSAQKLRKKMTTVQNHPPPPPPAKTTNTYSVSARRAVWARCTDVFNCCSEARAGSCKVLAKNIPWYPLVLPELSTEVSISTPRGCEGEMGHTAGPKRGPGTQIPALQTEIIFFSNISIKSVILGLSFLQLYFILKTNLSMMLQYF